MLSFQAEKLKTVLYIHIYVNEQFWKVPEGRIAPGFTPLDNRKFSSCLPNGNLRVVEGDSAGITAVDVAVIVPADKAEAPAELSGHFHQH